MTQVILHVLQHVPFEYEGSIVGLNAIMDRLLDGLAGNEEGTQK